ncbi:hypothetical protein HUS23_12005 [Ectothiorhodospiraceae bacterium 2226]|nr:hypothetical protein HUS23_12005 [Ectothiorhodospiraceae bacterium 2226]
MTAIGPTPPRGGWRRAAALAGAAALAVLVGGCATLGDSNERLQAQVSAANPAAAQRVLDGAQRSRADEVLYRLNQGMLLRFQGEFVDSNVALEEAKQRIESLRALSLSEQAGALAVSEGRRAYLGEPYEQSLIYLYKALNYLALDDAHSARVEMLQADLFLRSLKPEQRARAAEPALRYVAGLVFEHLAEPDQAMVAYRLALAALDRAKAEVPGPLRESLLQLSHRLGLSEEYTTLEQRFGPRPADRDPDAAELVLLIQAGLVPPKREQAVQALDPHSGRFYRIAAPYYPPRSGNATVRVSIDNPASEVRSTLLQDLDALSRRVLDDQMGAIMARAVARAVIKTQAVRQAADRDPALGLLTNVATAMTERADTRSWLTLPAQLHVARLHVPPGAHTVHVEVGTGAGRHRITVEVPALAAGERAFLAPHLPGSIGS